VWGYESALHITVPQPAKASIYTVAGILVKQQNLLTGETILPLQAGIYIVRVDGQTFKVKI
jgi:hypothetical protein